MSESVHNYEEATDQVRPFVFFDHSSPEYLGQMTGLMEELRQKLQYSSDLSPLVGELQSITEDNAAMLAFKVAAYDRAITLYLARFSDKGIHSEGTLARLAELKTALTAAKLVCESQGIDIEAMKDAHYRLRH